MGVSQVGLAALGCIWVNFWGLTVQCFDEDELCIVQKEGTVLNMGKFACRLSLALRNTQSISCRLGALRPLAVPLNWLLGCAGCFGTRGGSGGCSPSSYRLLASLQ